MFGLPSRSRLAALLPLSITLPLVAAACGDDGREDSESGTASNTDPATTDSTATNSGSETETTMGPGGSDSTSDTGTTFDVTTDDPSVTETITASDPTTTTEGGCDASDQCDVGELCIMGECAPAGEPCDSNADCEGDTYCCKEGCLPPGEEPGTCLPWPDGDFDGACEGELQIGLFAPAVQCEWTQPPDGDPYPGHVNVLTTPLVADLPHAGGGEFGSTEVIIVTYNYTDGGAESGWGSNPAYYGVIRILSGRTCQQLETIDDPNNRLVAASTPAIGDLDGDGIPEIVSHRAVTGVVAFKWNPQAMKYETYWVATETDLNGAFRWDGPSIHDLDDDGFPEVLSGSGVFDGMTGARLNPGPLIPGASPAVSPGVINIAGDLDVDGRVELIAGPVYEWDENTAQWVMDHPGGNAARHYAFADFGTPGPMPADFDATVLDGIAEIVTTGGSSVQMWTLGGQQLFNAPIAGGGPLTIGDFDNDGFPEVASAGGTFYAVYDLECAVAGPGCLGGYVRWSQASQDASSSTTGSSIFDFEGDGQAEAVYADECFTRVYDGLTGDVLYSAYRTSCTWYENAVVADVDNDERSEIVVNSNNNCNVSCPAIDPIHPGARCETVDDCASGVCDAGFCRCTIDAECPEDHVCTSPLQNTPGMGNTCRAANPPLEKRTGVRILRDVLDRWASSRPIWNQHAYSVTNIQCNA